MIGSVLGYMVWPVIIIVSYWLIRVSLHCFEKKQAEE